MKKPVDEPLPSEDPSAIPVSSVETTPTLEILPAIERETTPTQDPFGSAAQANAFTVLGILTNSDGVTTAIVSAGSINYIVEAGDLIGTLKWSVKEITADKVLLTDGKEELTLSLKVSPVLRP